MIAHFVMTDIQLGHDPMAKKQRSRGSAVNKRYKEGRRPGLRHQGFRKQVKQRKEGDL